MFAKNGRSRLSLVHNDHIDMVGTYGTASNDHITRTDAYTAGAVPYRPHYCRNLVWSVWRLHPACTRHRPYTQLRIGPRDMVGETTERPYSQARRPTWPASRERSISARRAAGMVDRVQTNHDSTVWCYGR